MNAMLNDIRGIICFKASGVKIYRFINGVREEGIVCTNQHCTDQVFYGQIYSKDRKKLESLARNLNIELEITEKKGMRFKVLRYRWRAGILIGLTVLSGFVFYISNTVVSIEVCGNSAVTDERIIDALGETGIYKGRFIADINFLECERRLRLSIPELAWTGIRHTGSRIVVDVTEVTPKPEMVLDDVPCNIVASKNAQITSVIVHRGQLIKQKGEAVKKGDVIISGVVEDDKGKSITRHAMGEITGIYKEDMTFTQYYTERKAVYDEKSTNKKYIEFFGARIPAFLKKAEFDTYDYNECTNYFMLFGRKIPIGIVHANYAPFSYEETEFSQEEAEKLLSQQAALYEKNFYDSFGITVLDRSIELKTDSEKAEYIVSYTLEGNIAEDREIFIKEAPYN